MSHGAGLDCITCEHLQVRDWYVDSFKELRQFPEVKDSHTELQFTSLLKVRHEPCA
jgi:hypothetical protein